MANLTIYNDNNSQIITLRGLADSSGNPVNSATITGLIRKNGVPLENGGLTFVPVSGSPGDYSAPLNGFDGQPGSAQLLITGTSNGVSFNLVEFVTIAERTV